MSSSTREELRSRVRFEASPPEAAVVIRGGPDTPTLLRSHALRLSRLYLLDGEPIFGVSVFVALVATGPTSERSILAGKLRRYPTIYRATTRSLAEAGFWLLPTFSAPHYTVAMRSLDAVDDLAAAFGSPLINPYAEGRMEER